MDQVTVLGVFQAEQRAVGRESAPTKAVLVDAALEGLGLAYVFESMVQKLLTEKRLVRVLDKHCPQIPGYFLYYPGRVNLAPKLKALVDFLKDSDGRANKRPF